MGSIQDATVKLGKFMGRTKESNIGVASELDVSLPPLPSPLFPRGGEGGERGESRNDEA